MNRLNIKWIGSPNYGLPRGTTGRNGHKPIAIVYHIMEGSLAGTASWFKHPDSRVSSHFGIGKNGSIHQYVKDEDVAWANGSVKEPSWDLLIEGVNPNLYTLSIEHEGFSKDIFTEAMFKSSIELTKHLMVKWDIPAEKNRFIGHNEITINKPDCPGPNFPWDRLLKEVGVLMSGPFPDVTVDHWASNAVKFVKENGLMDGYPDGMFHGNENISRYELAVVVERLVKKMGI